MLLSNALDHALDEDYRCWSGTVVAAVTDSPSIQFLITAKRPYTTAAVAKRVLPLGARKAPPLRAIRPQGGGQRRHPHAAYLFEPLHL